MQDPVQLAVAVLLVEIARAEIGPSSRLSVVIDKAEIVFDEMIGDRLHNPADPLLLCIRFRD